nr:immunoglobulin heavy chain junction region [Mus musculus]MBK4196402.1 immunoglobulin heavy chain junction region [Mus musculus]MBK4196403.1 immunoglobulin heavy chain junction region [Mus musculus]
CANDDYYDFDVW